MRAGTWTDEGGVDVAGGGNSSGDDVPFSGAVFFDEVMTDSGSWTVSVADVVNPSDDPSSAAGADSVAKTPAELQAL